VARYYDAAHLSQSWGIASQSEHVRASLARLLLSELVRIERVPMLRLPSAAPSAAVELAHNTGGKVYEMRAYNVKDYQPPSALDGLLANQEARAYSDWLAAHGGRVAAHWMRCSGPVEVTSSAALVGSEDAPVHNASDQVPDLFSVVEWDDQLQAAQAYAMMASDPVAAYRGNPFAREGAPHRIERLEVTWSDAVAIGRTLIHSGVCGLSYDSGHFHTPKRR